MSKTIQLPSGGTAEVREPEELRSKDQDALELVVAHSGAIENEYADSVGTVILRIALAKRLIIKWDLPYAPGMAIPTEDPDAWGELTIGDRKMFTDEADAALKVLYPKPPTPDDAGVPDSPTKPADA